MYSSIIFIASVLQLIAAQNTTSTGTDSSDATVVDAGQCPNGWMIYVNDDGAYCCPGGVIGIGDDAYCCVGANWDQEVCSATIPLTASNYASLASAAANGTSGGSGTMPSEAYGTVVMSAGPNLLSTSSGALGNGASATGTGGSSNGGSSGSQGAVGESGEDGTSTGSDSSSSSSSEGVGAMVTSGPLAGAVMLAGGLLLAV